MPERPTLGDYQEALVELLSSGLSPEEVIAQLRNDVRFANYHEYTDGFDSDMIAVAGELVRKWGKKI
jgi:hypothetical protein